MSDLIQVHVKLYGMLRDYLPAEQKGRATLTVAGSTTVQEIVTSLGIEHEVMVAINQQHEVDYSDRLQANDTLILFEMAAGG